ncbi:MAG: bifunctional 4-hydroxy-2-oxoglutarate aldolase/2-dehydro-3-deoxy-phosphogluconate aldolase, partial [Chloroflexota bacterium]|nr:bifunctional 4-hydroxy-2-oxoglutarate aldolase/2-dehydro-3-deoxy-phosphogluconate aldolase [Chloroflexota bacterium]
VLARARAPVRGGMKNPTAPEEATPRDATARLIRENRLVVVLRRVEPHSQLLEIVRATFTAGARVFEITLDSPTALDDIAATRRVLETSATPFAVGAGTVLTSEQLQYAKRAGADFAVSPVLDEGVLREAVASGVPFIPGALSPSEMARGWSLGATFVKVFPASSVGPLHVREVLAPMPHLQLIATGGIDGGTARSFLDAGAAAVGIGSAFVRATAAERRALIAALAPDA